jgi:ribosome-associated toxin RatA of RatAB toxin-antitoxin module
MLRTPLMATRRAPLFALAIALASVVAHAAERAPINRYAVKVPSCDFRAGGARTVVSAPASTVRALVQDYGRYSDFIKPFEASKIVGRDGEKTDVYLRIKILRGAAKIWAVVRFEPPAGSGETETVSAKMRKGNVKRLDATWRIRAVDDAHTEVALEILLVPDFPAPEALVIPEVRDAAATALDGLRNEAEKRASEK